VKGTYRAARVCVLGKILYIYYPFLTGLGVLYSHHDVVQPVQDHVGAFPVSGEFVVSPDCPCGAVEPDKVTWLTWEEGGMQVIILFRLFCSLSAVDPGLIMDGSEYSAQPAGVVAALVRGDGVTAVGRGSAGQVEREVQHTAVQHLGRGDLGAAVRGGPVGQQEVGNPGGPVALIIADNNG
jgi:hypothetical protein